MYIASWLYPFMPPFLVCVSSSSRLYLLRTGVEDSGTVNTGDGSLYTHRHTIRTNISGTSAGNVVHQCICTHTFTQMILFPYYLSSFSFHIPFKWTDNWYEREEREQKNVERWDEDFFG